MPQSLLTHVVASAVVLVLPVGVAWAQPGGPQGATPVGVSPVVEREVEEGRTFVGTVHPLQASVVGSAVDGRVEEVTVNDGDWVTKDQTLTQLRTKTIKLEIAAAQAELQLRQRELDELNEGSRPEEKAQAQAVLRRAEALFAYANSRLERTLALPESALSQEELEQDRSSRDAAEQAWLEAQANWNLVVEGPRKEKILQAEARVEMQEAEIARLEDLREKYTIRAPFKGYVVAKHAEVGQWLSRADPVVEMVSVDPIEVWVSIPEDYIASLSTGTAAPVRLDALDGLDASSDPVVAEVLKNCVNAEIARIIPQADLRSRSFPVRIQLGNPLGEHGHVIKPGMLAHVTVAVGQPRPALLVPKDALVLGGRDTVVYVVAADVQSQALVANPVPVQLGVSVEGDIQVIGDLRAGQDVVVLGNERLRPGTKVRPLRRPE